MGKYQFRDDGVSTQNDRGEWVPAIPLPWFIGWSKVRCHCGASFWSAKAYRGHYALEHILGLE
jgi:hypothetical protein